MTHATPTTVYRQDYTPPAYLIRTIDLQFTLGNPGEPTVVKSTMRVIKNSPTTPHADFILDGDPQTILISAKINTVPAQHDFQQDGQFTQLVLKNPPVEEFVLEITNHIFPDKNSSLEGLYFVKNLFCTQCEAQGFRKITYYPDRPDVMALFTTSIIANKKAYPVLLSNGNLVKHGEVENQPELHFVTWSDPFKKPCYLFALVAGDLACVEDEFITQSGRHVQIKLYVEHGDEDKTAFALQSIKKAMRWDEENYGREYDLDIFMVVATHDFNMGAMENKGLNIFNSKYILAKPETATDEDYIGIERVIGHEYFHNWTGNRITCRDWFQLSLKESLTVFRDAQFSADMTSHAVVRIDDVNVLRNTQFPQDAGPMAHPVRPESYMEINNFYTVTIYEKGAEVIRMLYNLLGKTGFRRGMDLYFERFDGEAVTIDDFVQAHADANHKDLSQFMLWYTQAGTPVLNIETNYDAGKKQYSISIQQHCPATPNQDNKKPMQMPFKIGLLDSVSGKEVCDKNLEITQEQQVFIFDNISSKPVVSLLRDFSAPVKIQYAYQPEELAFLMQHDTDAFARWNASQQLGVYFIKQALNKNNFNIDLLLNSWRRILQNKNYSHDAALAAELLSLPALQYLIELLAPVNLDDLFSARENLRRMLAENLHAELFACYAELSEQTKNYAYNAESIAARALKNRCLSYLGLIDDKDQQRLILTQLESANNMTDEISALAALCHSQSAAREDILSLFYQKWQNEPLVIDKWLAVQARSELPGALARVKILMQHPAFDIKNPNKVRSLIGAFCQNLPQFHAIDGSGYIFLSEQIIILNNINPLIAARLVEPLTRFRKYDEARQQMMKAELERIRATPGLAVDIYEVVSKSLASGSLA